MTAPDVRAAAPDYPAKRDAACPFAPPPVLRALAEEAPLSRVTIWDGSTPWLVTGHESQRALLGDERVSVDEHRAGFPLFSQAMRDTLEHRPAMVFNLDGAEHRRLRKILTRAFTAKRVQALRPAIQRITDELIDAMLAGPKPADLVTSLAVPLPSLMICELLGVPYEDRDFFQERSAVGVGGTASAEESGASMQALTEYLIGLVRSKKETPGDDVLSDIAERVTAGELSEVEGGLLGLQALVAGHETSANMIALGTVALLRHPEQLALLRDTDDPAVVATATEELLRYLTIPQVGQRRIATADIEIAGEVIREGEGIIIDLPTGNRDPDVFDAPEALDLRSPQGRHQAFGFGPHQCVGQQLARAELQIVYGTLFRRIPTLTPAVEFDEIEFKHDALAFGVHALPVTW
ncbi:Cytochrome P450 [Prauserella aidingensis]|uniref:cytochrome P450 n=1 Tax=Prauserella aidingensis TaxID=387890 RepID=UPI0020A25348|nr:cytochrome P450 [Prauserella aidingensis]MCP2253820.1 Cytochrome P450 [Prauserella aidingensis]